MHLLKSEYLLLCSTTLCRITPNDRLVRHLTVTWTINIFFPFSSQVFLISITFLFLIACVLIYALQPLKAIAVKLHKSCVFRISCLGGFITFTPVWASYKNTKYSTTHCEHGDGFLVGGVTSTLILLVLRGSILESMWQWILPQIFHLHSNPFKIKKCDLSPKVL